MIVPKKSLFAGPVSSNRNVPVTANASLIWNNELNCHGENRSPLTVSAWPSAVMSQFSGSAGGGGQALLAGGTAGSATPSLTKVKLVAAQADADTQSAAAAATNFVPLKPPIVSSVTGLDPSEEPAWTSLQRAGTIGNTNKWC